MLWLLRRHGQRAERVVAAIGAAGTCADAALAAGNQRPQQPGDGEEALGSGADVVQAHLRVRVGYV